MGLINDIRNKVRDGLWSWLSEGRLTMLLTQEERKKHKTVVLARRYYNGDHDVHLTERQKEWLKQHGDTAQFNVNHCPTVVDTVVERLSVIGFQSPGEDKEDPERFSKVAWDWWQANRMDAVQTEAHRWAVRDGEAFILVDWDETEKRPDYVLHQRYIDESAGGDGYGMWVEYPNDDYLQKPLRAVKQWTEKDVEGKKTQRRTVYYPDRVERFIQKDGKWAEFKENESDAWPTPWAMKDGSPIGIPVAHLRNPKLKSDLKDVITLQDALNKAWVDIIAASDTTAFRWLIFKGLVPTTDGKEPKEDGSNLLKLTPGQNWATKAKPDEVAVQPIEPADLTPLLNVEDRIVVRIASVSNTPLSRFMTSRQIAAEGTLKQQEAPLLGKVKERQTLFGNAWEDMTKLGARLANTFGEGGIDLVAKISTLWDRAELRDDKAHLEELAIKGKLGVDEEQLWREMGYDEDQIDNMATAKAKQSAIAIRAQVAAATAASTQPANGAAKAGETNGKQAVQAPAT